MFKLMLSRGALLALLLISTSFIASTALADTQATVAPPVMLALLDLDSGFTPAVLMSDAEPSYALSDFEATAHASVSEESLPLPPFWFALLVAVLGAWSVFREGVALDEEARKPHG